MRSGKRDRSFLFLAGLAGFCGVLCIGVAIVVPLWAHMRGMHLSPAVELFAAYGIAALWGSWACVQTYFLSDAPRRPPRGGIRLKLLNGIDARAKPQEPDSATAPRRAA